MARCVTMPHAQPMTNTHPAYWIALGVVLGGYITTAFILIGSVL